MAYVHSKNNMPQQYRLAIRLEAWNIVIKFDILSSVRKLINQVRSCHGLTNPTHTRQTTFYTHTHTHTHTNPSSWIFVLKPWLESIPQTIKKLQLACNGNSLFLPKLYSPGYAQYNCHTDLIFELSLRSKLVEG